MAGRDFFKAMNPTNEPHDDELCGLLREMGQAGRRRAPSFPRVWQAAHEARACAPTSRWWPAWALGAAAAACAVFVLNRPSVTALPSDEPLPTDFLLVASEDARAGQLAGEITALLQP